MKYIYALLVVILDWDDTVFPSSYLVATGHGLEEPHIEATVLAELQVLEEVASRFLLEIQKHATCVIVTNAEAGWVELSAARFMPKLASVVNKLRIVSARTTYERYYPDSPVDWKVRT